MTVKGLGYVGKSNEYTTSKDRIWTVDICFSFFQPCCRPDWKALVSVFMVPWGILKIMNIMEEA